MQRFLLVVVVLLLMELATSNEQSPRPDARGPGARNLIITKVDNKDQLETKYSQPSTGRANKPSVSDQQQQQQQQQQQDGTNADLIGGMFKLLGNIVEPKKVEADATSSASMATRTITTTSTTPNPVMQLGKNLENLGHTMILSSKISEVPLKLVNGLLSTTIDLSQAGTKTVDKTADKLVEATGQASKRIAHQLARAPDRVGTMGGSEYADEDHYNYDSGFNDPFSYKRPKYFSRECQFRVACEIGKLVKPIFHEISKGIASNKFLQDLQNRYTRAMVYGSARGQCDRYYCALVALFGGPAGFASGIAEIVNRVANPDMYERYDYLD